MTGRDELRRAAEERARERAGTHGDPEDAADLATLVHELRVHQIELELQNEELRRTHGVLEAARAEYADLYDEAPVAYFSLDESAVVVRSNRTFASFLGVSHDRIVGKPVSELIAPDARDRFLRRFRALFAEPAGKSLDAVFQSADGSDRVLHLTVHRSPRGLRPDTGSKELRVAAVDVTDRRDAERRVKELLDQKQLLYRELRHRTSNNYQVVLAMLSLQMDLAHGERVVDALTQAYNRIQSMVVVQESLAESQLDSRLEIGPYLDDVLRRVASALDPDSRVEIVSSFEDATTDADTGSTLGIILNEITTNAWKHAFAGRPGGRFEVTLAREREQWVLSLSDDGAGASPAPADDAGHHGLGETLVEALASQLGGSFSRDTTADETRCAVRLPGSCITVCGSGDERVRRSHRTQPPQPPKSGA